MTSTREQRLEQALFRGGGLTLENPEYALALRTFTDALLRADLAPGDLTVEALELENQLASGTIVAREPGVAAGLGELAFMLRGFGVHVQFEKKDGEAIERGDVVLRAQGGRSAAAFARARGPESFAKDERHRHGDACACRRARAAGGRAARIVATRKTPWGLLDKRAVHLGGGGTHRLGLGDAILIKNNHLALIAGREEEAAPEAIRRAWNFRRQAAFIEVEVRSEAAALAAARAFRRMREESVGAIIPCLLMLDNMTPEEISGVLGALERESLRDATL